MRTLTDQLDNESDAITMLDDNNRRAYPNPLMFSNTRPLVSTSFDDTPNLNFWQSAALARNYSMPPSILPPLSPPPQSSYLLSSPQHDRPIGFDQKKLIDEIIYID